MWRVHLFCGGLNSFKIRKRDFTFVREMGVPMWTKKLQNAINILSLSELEIANKQENLFIRDSNPTVANI